MNLRNPAIDLVKFIAVILIINSHFDEQYVYCKDLATGGAIGDGLFFFCSGYTLFLGRLDRFDSWYKRRIRRIYPSVLALGLLMVLVFGGNITLGSLFTEGAGWFVNCIMIYYVLLYFVRRFALRHLKTVYFIVIIILLGWFSLFFDPMNTWIHTKCKWLDWLVFCQPMDKTWIYQWNYFKWGFFFLFMLFGANVGIIEIKKPNENGLSFFQLLVKLLICIVVFYAIPWYIQFHPEEKGWLILSIIPLLGVCFYFYQICNTNVIKSVLKIKYVSNIITITAGLCLEIYLVQPYVRTTALNFLFPLNLLIIFVVIVFVAYLCRMIARLILQIFLEKDGICWKDVIRL